MLSFSDCSRKAPAGLCSIGVPILSIFRSVQQIRNHSQTGSQFLTSKPPHTARITPSCSNLCVMAVETQFSIFSAFRLRSTSNSHVILFAITHSVVKYPARFLCTFVSHFLSAHNPGIKPVDLADFKTLMLNSYSYIAPAWHSTSCRSGFSKLC